jgi:hypothetical protein
LDRAFANLKELKLYPADKIERDPKPTSRFARSQTTKPNAGHVAAAIDLYQALLNRISAAGTPAESSLPVAARVSYRLSVAHRASSPRGPAGQSGCSPLLCCGAFPLCRFALRLYVLREPLAAGLAVPLLEGFRGNLRLNEELSELATLGLAFEPNAASTTAMSFRTLQFLSIRLLRWRGTRNGERGRA